MKQGVAFLGFVVWLGMACGLLLGKEGMEPVKNSVDYSALYDRFRTSLVTIENPAAPKGKAAFLGSGIVISPQGYIVTADSLLEKRDRVTVINGTRGYYFAASVVGRDSRNDLALLKVKTKLPLDYVTFDRSKNLKAGDMLLLLEEREEQRLLSALVTSESPGGFLLDMSPGGYGAAVVDTDGLLVGLVSKKRSKALGTRTSYEAAAIADSLKRMMAEARVLQAYFSMAAEDLDPSLYGYYGIDRGVLVTQVEENATADMAGLKRGDLIVGLGETPIVDKRALVERIMSYKEENNVTVHYVRHALNKSLQIRLSRINRELLNPKAFWYKGMVLENITQKLAQFYNIPPYLKGVVVTLVEPGSAAEAGGMRQGDVIIQCETKSITDLNLFKTTVNKGKKEHMYIYRDGWNFIKLF